MINKNEEIIELVNAFRMDWKTTSGKKLSLNDFNEKLDMNVFRESVKKAYRASTTRALKNPNKINTKAIKESLIDVIANDLNSLYISNDNYDFSIFESELSTKVRNAFKDKGLDDYTYGNAQKWINLSIKYLLSSNYVDPMNPLFKNCFVPIDSIVMKMAKKQLNVKEIGAWSKCDDIEKIINYEKEIKKATDALGYYSPLIWEIKNWNR